MYRTSTVRRHLVARERAAAYSPSVSAGQAIDLIAAGIEQLQKADLTACPDSDVAGLLAGLVDAQTRLAAAEAKTITEFDRREAHRADACVSTATWLRWRTSLGIGDAKRRVRRAGQLQRMPLLAGAMRDGDISTDHADAVARRAIPARAERIAEHDDALTALARKAEPRAVAVAVQRIVELVDDDGTEEPPDCSINDLRTLGVTDGFGELGRLMGDITPRLREIFLRTRDLYSTPDPEDTPLPRQRTPSMRFHDAIEAALCVAIDNHPTSRVDGVNAHFVAFCDLFTLMGKDELATITPRLGTSGRIDAETARHLLATSNVTLRLVLGLGPWMPVTVSRTRRVLPEWLRGTSQMIHQHCRGPGCDAFFSWTEADHLLDHAKGGETGLFNDGPECRAHHDLKHTDGWTISFNPHNGTITWTSPDGQRYIDVEPPDP